MIDKPILFSAPMIRALLAGSKTQTRRALTRQPDSRCTEAFMGADGVWRFSRPTARAPISSSEDDRRLQVSVGDRLWVKERLQRIGDEGVAYFADAEPHLDARWVWKKDSLPSIHCPRGLSRMTLIVTDVRVQRLQEISEEDAHAEGALLPWTGSPGTADSDTRTARSEFEALWNSINGPGAWETNPWVAAYTFRVVHANIYTVPEGA